MSGDVVIAIDAGGTAVKVVAFDLDGREIAGQAANVETDHHPDGRVERDPEAFWAGTKSALQHVVAACRDRNILAVGCTGFGNGIFLVDENGNGTRPGIVSVDHRAQPIVDELEASGLSDTLTKRTGNRIWGGQTIMQLTHLARHEPETVARTRWALACKDFIRIRLTGEAITDPTDASGGGLMDLEADTYAKGVFKELQIAEMIARLPPIVPSEAVGGRVSEAASQETGLPAGTPVAGSMMDVAACALGSGGVGEPVMTMIAGTWSINTIECNRPRPGQTPMLQMSYLENGRRLIADGSPCSAANLGWFLDSGLAGRVSVKEAGELVKHAPVSGPRCHYLPYVFGPGSRRAAFTDLTATDNLGTMLRAIFEGVAFQHRLHAQVAAGIVGDKFPQTIRLAGGAAKSEIWAQIFADICQRPVEAVRASEVGALGAAICAAVAGGAFGSLAEAARQMTGVARRYEPDPDLGGFYDDRFRQFQHLGDGMHDLQSREPRSSGS